jgi:hypothetical protein
VRVVNTILFQIVIENIEQKERFAATAYAGDHFNKAITLTGNKFLQVLISFDVHITLYFCHM